MCNNNKKYVIICFVIPTGKDDLGVLDNFDVGDDSSCSVETNLEGKLSRLYNDVIG